ncbi:MAG: SDR family oxidoreductase [Hyphomicrobiales bacterium]|nr:SDR family oxidoreductase [Hyphomicrobiales bacterium]
MDLKDRAAVVTGAASGLGRATAEALAAAGARVALLDVDERGLKTTADEVGGMALPCDITDADAVAAALAAARQAHGPVRVNVNCAAVPGSLLLVGRDGAVDMDRYAKVIAVNLLGTVSVMTKCAAEMMAAPPLDRDGERGLVVNTASIAAFEGQVGHGAYAAAKGGIASLTLPAAREFAPRGVRVVCIAPGLFETPMATDLPADVVRSFREKPLFPRRFGRPEEFAQMVLAVCANKMVNGATLRLDAAARLEPR